METGHRDICSHVVKQHTIFLVFQSPLNPDDTVINPHLAKHGDGVRDIAFTVDDATGLYNHAVKKGARSVRQPWTEEDESGSVILASVGTVT